MYLVEPLRYKQYHFIAIFTIMKALFFFITTLTFAVTVFGQFQDDFSDGDLSNNPTWLGQVDRFTTTDGELQLNDDEANVSYIAGLAPTSLSEETTWEFLVRLEFAPSASNFARVYLSSDQADLTGSLNGYFLKIGGISGDQDAIELFRQEGTDNTLLLSGTAGAVGADPALARVRVVRSSAGDWELFTDYTGGTSFNAEGTIQDNTIAMGSYFGFYCDYTATRAMSFFFDDVNVFPLFEDTTPPSLVSATALSATEVTVVFDEPLNAGSANTASNYAINNGIGNPSGATIDDTDPTLVTLELSTPLISNQTYTLTTENIADLNDNESGSQSTNFTFVDIQTAAVGDLIVTEIMADPNPPVGLPEAEYVEIYNRSDKVIDLGTMSFSSGAIPREIASVIIGPEEYVILCDDEFAADFEAFGTVAVINSFPALTNGGDDIFLINETEDTVFAITYNDDWYQDDEKDDGGYSLEAILLEDILLCANNWRASNAEAGGTPGQANSLDDIIPDDQAPGLVSVIPVSATDLLVTFSEDLDPNGLTNTSNYSVDNGLNVQFALPVEDQANRITLTLNEAIQAGIIYTLTVENVTDCIGNVIDETTNQATFGLLEQAVEGDILITEIMADPSPAVGLPEEEFIEIYNRSDKIIQLSGLFFSSETTPQQLPEQAILPGQYVIICDDGDVDQFSAFGAVAAVGSFPSLTNAGDVLLLEDADGNTIFSITYSDDWYQDETREDGGYTLEAILLDGAIGCAENWRASLADEGGTPGQENSVSGLVPEPSLPQLISAIPIGTSELLITFSDAIEEASAAVVENYSIDNGISISGAFLQIPQTNQILLTLNEELQPGTIYTITTTDGLKDCLGNPIGTINDQRFGLPEDIAAQDLVINEILFNPLSGGNDFVEYFNRSDKILNINSLTIKNTAKESGDTSATIDFDYLVFPGEYVVITEDPADILDRYLVDNPAALIQGGLPTLDANEGNATLVSADGIVIDAFDYLDDFHYALLDNDRGVSLERIDPETDTQNQGNWHSAAASVGFATPTAENSQFFPIPSVIDDFIDIPNTTFSPDEDGFEDILVINYEVDQVGYVLNARIFDATGRPIRTLLRNELLGNNGTFKWDGTTADGTRARIGIYVLWLELTNANGDVEEMKKAIVVAGRLD